jgi:GT2 family glycosyltransferase
MSKKVAIIIINWNSYDLTRDTLHSLNNVDDKNFDVIIVDNGSTDGSGDRLRVEFTASIFIKSETNRGFTGGNNIGFNYAIQNGYKYAMMLNNDVEVESGFLEPLVNVLDNNINIGAVQPLIYFHHDRELIWNAGSVFNKWTGELVTLEYNKRDVQHKRRGIKKNVDWLTGCAFLLRTEILSQIGLLKEDFFIYYEDVDLSFRIKMAGWELAYEPSSVIYHIGGMSHKEKEKGPEGFVNPKVHYLSARNHIWILKQYKCMHFVPTVVLYQTGYYTAVCLYFILRGRFTKLAAWFKGMKNGLVHNIYQ